MLLYGSESWVVAEAMSFVWLHQKNRNTFLRHNLRLTRSRLAVRCRNRRSRPSRRSIRFGKVAKQLAVSELEVYEHVDAVTFITDEDRDRGKIQLKQRNVSRPGEVDVTGMAIAPLLLRPTLSFAPAR